MAKQANSRSAYLLTQAEAYTAASGIYTEPTTDLNGGRNIAGVNPGDWAAYDVSFGGYIPTEIITRYAAVGAGQIIYRLDSLTGPVVATVEVAPTGGWQTWVTAHTPVNAALVYGGNHRLYMTFAAGNPGPFVNVNYFRVSHFAVTPPPPPAGNGLPVGDLPGWRQVFLDDFTRDAPLGSWATQDWNAVVYTGDHGGQWTTYPDGWPSTYTTGKPGYQPAQVLRVHDGVLDFDLHNVNGLPSGANPCPLINGSKYQLYGRYSARLRLDSHFAGYYLALLLWPGSDNEYRLAESDFPECGTNDTSVTAFAHYGGAGAQDAFPKSVDLTQWHVYTQEWVPGARRYYVDDVLIGMSTHQVYAKPQRWQLQVEPSGGGGSGHLLVDWVSIWAYEGAS